MLSPGTDVGGYRIEGLLGRGGMGIVYEATQKSLGRRVALKLLAADLSLDQSFRRRFQREGRLQAHLDHAHIVPIYEAGELEDHGLFIAMRLVRGATLKHLIRGGELDGRRLVAILRPVADALDTAHEAGLVHRDIKPQNILVGRRDHAYLADFGLTRAPGDTAFTKTGQFVGTLDYIAPEQIRGESPSPASDLYSFAAVAYECLTGSVPFPRPNEASVLFAHMSDPPPRPSARAPRLPEDVDGVIASGLAKAGADRPPTVLAFVDSLEAALGDAGAALPLGPPPAPADLFDPDSGYDAPPPAGASTVAGADPSSTVASPAPAESAVAASRRDAEAATPPETRAVTAAAAAPTTVARERTAAGEPAPEQDADELTEVRSRVGASTHADRRRPWPPGEQDAPPPRVAAGPAPVPIAPAPEARAATAPTVPAAAPAPGARAPRRRARSQGRAAAPRLPLVATAAVLVVAVGAGIVAGRSGGGSDAPPPAAATPERAALTAGPISLDGPAGWRPGDAPDVPGLALRNTAALDQASGAMVAGVSEAGGATLLPAALLRNLEGDAVRADSVRLGKHAAYRYRGLTVRGVDDPVTVLVMPTEAGVATLACTGTEHAREACEAASTSLELSVESYPLGPSASYAKRLRAAIGTLRARRAAALAKWRGAERPRAQAAAASDAAAAYTVATKAVGQLSATPLERDAQDNLRRALGAAKHAYGRVAAAARDADRGSYGAARQRARAAERGVRTALRRYAALGYKVR